MALEIERKFLVAGDGWETAIQTSRRLVQFYLTRDGRSSVRIRIEDDQRAWLTIKSASSGLSRHEFEYVIPVEDANGMRPLAEGAVIDKVRHVVSHGGHDWEIDVFAGDNAGLVVAEVELASAGQYVAMPAWIGPEVTHDRRYYNASLVLRPFKSW